LLVGAKVKFENAVAFGGGSIYTYCLTADSDVKAGCGADWVAGDSKLVLGMQATGSEVTARQITQALQHELENLAQRLGDDASPTVSSTTTSPAMITTITTIASSIPGGASTVDGTGLVGATSPEG
ncbi:MAG: hypothetical protein ABIQ39_01905, partial [Ilumatobacteraceae bacterium]